MAHREDHWAEAGRGLCHTISADLEAHLLFAAEGGHPILFEVEGSISTVSDREFEGRGGSSMSMHTEQEGAFEYVVEITVEAADE